MNNKEWFYKLKGWYKGTEGFLEYTTRDGKEAFAYWDGKTYCNSYTRRDGNGHKKLTVVCLACLQDKNPDVRTLAKNLKFKSNKYSIQKGSYPCGCSVQRGKTLLQHFGIDELIGVEKKYENNSLTVKKCLGGKGNKRKYILECNICSEDEELWPYGSITSTKSNFQTRKQPCCGCNTNKTIMQEWQHKVRVERLCKEKGLEFKGWNGEFSGTNTTKVLMECPYHGDQ